MNIFDFRDQLIDDYASYIKSFIQIRDLQISDYVQQKLQEGVLWPEPLIQLNPLFARGETIDELVKQGTLHRECARIFRKDKAEDDDKGRPLHLHRHQSEAIRVARGGHSYVLTTGTGSGKSLAYIIPIVDYVLRSGSGRGIQAIVVYPMNALANSQLKELEKFLLLGYPNKKGPVTFARYTGQETDEERQRIIANPPDILLTNYVMLELILTRSTERRLLSSQTLRFLVLDELHTYRGRQGADVALLVRRVMTRDSEALAQGIRVPAIIYYEAVLYEAETLVRSIQQFLKGCRHFMKWYDLQGATHTSPGPQVTFRDLSQLHPAIADKCQHLFETGAYPEAVEKSFKVVRDRLRSLTSHETGSEAFGKGKLHIKGAAAANVDNDFNEGVKFLTMAIDRFRNEKSHTSDGNITDPQHAYEYLTISSLAMHLLDRAEIIP